MKLKHLKYALKQWRKQTFDTPRIRIQQLKDKLISVHNKLDSDPLNSQFQSEELNLQAELGTWLAH